MENYDELYFIIIIMKKYIIVKKLFELGGGETGKKLAPW